MVFFFPLSTVFPLALGSGFPFCTCLFLVWFRPFPGLGVFFWFFTSIHQAGKRETQQPGNWRKRQPEAPGGRGGRLCVEAKERGFFFFPVAQTRLGLVFWPAQPAPPPRPKRPFSPIPCFEAAFSLPNPEEGGVEKFRRERTSQPAGSNFSIPFPPREALKIRRVPPENKVWGPALQKKKK